MKVGGSLCFLLRLPSNLWSFASARHTNDVDLGGGWYILTTISWEPWDRRVSPGKLCSMLVGFPRAEGSLYYLFLKYFTFSFTLSFMLRHYGNSNKLCRLRYQKQFGIVIWVSDETWCFPPGVSQSHFKEKKYHQGIRPWVGSSRESSSFRVLRLWHSIFHPAQLSGTFSANTMICLENLLSRTPGTLLSILFPTGRIDVVAGLYEQECTPLPACPCVVPLINVQAQSKIY